MAKKVAVPDEKNVDAVERKIKKKHGKCCTCCLVCLIIFVAILAAAFGIGWYFGDKFTKEQFGMSLVDTLGVLGDLYWTDDEDVVSRPYSKNDLDGFYSELKRNILLKDDADVDFDSALVKALDNYISSPPVTRASSRNADGEGTGETVGVIDESSSNDASIMNVFADMIADVLTRDNIDIERLNAYDENDPTTDEYLFDLNDKQLAAFVNSVLKGVLKNAPARSSVSDINDIVNLSSVVSLKQIRFAARNAKTDTGESIVTATTADITVWLGLQKAANQAIKHYMKQAGVGWLGGIAGWFGDVILPENVYITLTVPLYGDGDIIINFNTMNASERARAYKLINGIMGGDKTLDDVLGEFADKIKPYLEKASDNMSFDEIKSGTIEIDLLETVAGLASESDADKLTKADFLYLLQAVFSDPAEQYARISPYLYENRYRDGESEVYLPSGSDTLELIDYEAELIKEIEQKYAVKFEADTKLVDVLAMLGVSLDGNNTAAGSKDLVKLIDGRRFAEVLDEAEKNPSSVKLKVTDKMLGAAFAVELDAQLKNGSSAFGDITVTLKALTFTRKDEDKALPTEQRKLYAMLAIEVGLDGITSALGDSLISRLATGLLPENILLTLTVDITRSRAEGETPSDVEYVLNSCLNTDRAIKTLEKLVPSFDVKGMSEDIETMLNDMLDMMYKNMDIELVSTTMQYDEQTGWSGEGGAVVMPSIFAIINDTVLVKDGEKVFEDEADLRGVLKGINNTAEIAAVLEGLPPIAESDERFVAEVVKKYYLGSDTLTDFDSLVDYMDNFDTSMLRITGTDTKQTYLAYDTTDVDDLRPVMHSDEIGYMLQQNMSGDIGKYAVKNIMTGVDKLIIILEIDLDDLLPDNDVRFMLSADVLYVTAEIDTATVIGGGDEPLRYDVKMDINSMDKATYENTLKLVRFFNSSFDINEQINEIGEILYEQMDSLNNSMLARNVEIPVDPTDPDSPTVPTEPAEHNFFAFTENGLEMVDFYTFLASKMESEREVASKTLKRVIQGLYQVPDIPEFADNPNNYVLSDILCVDGMTAEEWSDDEVNDFTAYGGTYADVDFNGYLIHSVRQVAKREQANVEQTVILKSGDPNATAVNMRTWANDKLGKNTVGDGTDYMFVTFSLGMDSFQDADSAQDVKGFELETVYFTVVYEFVDNRFTVVGSIFNNMTTEEYEVLKDFMNMSEDATDPTKVNINTIVDASVQGLAILTNGGTVTLGTQYNGSGIGSISYSR